MENIRIARAPISVKLFASILICVLGLAYLSLLGAIYQDTAMQPAVIAEAYGSMEVMELTHHTEEYLPYYTVFLFVFPVLIFLFTSYSENVKRFFAVFPFVMIVADVGSMWLIPYVNSTIFSWTLLFAGSFLGLSFLSLFLLNMYDIWLRKA